MEMTNKRFVATIKWLDTGDIQDNMILKIGDIGEDDDALFATRRRVRVFDPRVDQDQ